MASRFFVWQLLLLLLLLLILVELFILLEWDNFEPCEEEVGDLDRERWRLKGGGGGNGKEVKVVSSIKSSLEGWCLSLLVVVDDHDL